jgi:predicted nucleotidyltransferase
MNSGLEHIQLKEIALVLGEFPSIESGILFGSRATGKFSPSSDVDIALVGDAVTLKEQIQVSAGLNANKTLLKYDVIRFSTITNRKLIDQIRKYGVKIYECKKT